jgi:hypothetical protein
MLKANIIEQVTKYIKLKYDFLESWNEPSKPLTHGQLNLPGNRHSFAERLVADIFKASLYAEKNDQTEWGTSMVSKVRLSPE